MESKITSTGIGLLIFGIFSNIMAEVLPMIFGELSLFWVRAIFSISLVGMLVGLCFVWWGYRRTSHKISQYRIEIEKEREKRAKRRELLKEREPHLYRLVDIVGDMNKRSCDLALANISESLDKNIINRVMTDVLVLSKFNLAKLPQYSHPSPKAEWKTAIYVFRLFRYMKKWYEPKAEMFFKRVGELLDEQQIGLEHKRDNDTEYQSLFVRYKREKKYMSPQVLVAINRYLDYSFGLNSFLLLRTYWGCLGGYQLHFAFFNSAIKNLAKRFELALDILLAQALDMIDDYVLGGNKDGKGNNM